MYITHLIAQFHTEFNNHMWKMLTTDMFCFLSMHALKCCFNSSQHYMQFNFYFEKNFFNLVSLGFFTHNHGQNPTLRSTTGCHYHRFSLYWGLVAALLQSVNIFPVGAWGDSKVLPLLEIHTAFLFALAVTGCLPFPMFQEAYCFYWCLFQFVNMQSLSGFWT